MLSMIGSVVGLACLACEADAPVATQPGRLQRPVLVNQQVSDGCTRFALRVVNGAPVVEAWYNTTGCPTDQLKLETDSAPVFDAATGRLRVPLVIRNTGNVAVVAPARIRFVADSAQFLNGQGQVIPGLPDIVAVNYDTANANGRVGQWRYDTLLAASGAPQVLAPGAVSRRRWLEFAGTSWNQIVRIKLPTVGTVVGSVPMIPPDSFPRALVADSNMVLAPAQSTFRVAKNALLLMFVAGATSAQRQAAVDLIAGTVVGGFRLFGDGDGEYVIQVAPHPQAATVFTAIAALQALPYVAHATPISGMGMRSQYRRPADGIGFTASDWSVSRTSTFAKSWAQSSLRLPLAWGCSVGDGSVAIAIVDDHLYSADDLQVSSAHGRDRWMMDSAIDLTIAHGTRVTSVASAIGNNLQGLTGAAWNADVRFYDRLTYYPSLDSIPRSPDGTVAVDNVPVLISVAAEQGAGIINVSIAGSVDLDSLASSPGVADAHARRIARRLAAVLTRLDQRGLRPVIVFAAGNQSLDARLAGVGYLRDPSILTDATIRERVLVVGGVGRSLTGLWSLSNRTSIDVVAPAESVWTRGRKIGSVHLDGYVEGTSFSAPLVSGLAALLRAFDSRLTGNEVAQLIRAGAAGSGLAFGGTPLVDAYESLKLAAQRPGAPLCGNRVFARNDSVYAQRDPANNASDELLGLFPQAWPALAVEHGGRAITNHLISGTGLNTLVYGSSAWTLQARMPQFPNSGFARSTEGTSHDGDTLVAAIAQTSSAVTWALTDPQLNVLSPALTVSFGSPFTNMRSGYDPFRPRVLVSLQDPSLSKLWLLDFAAQSVTPMPSTYAGREVDYIGIAEDGEEARLLLRDMGGASVGSCAIHYVSLRSATFGVLQRAITVPKRSTGFCAGDGAIAPRVASGRLQSAVVLPGSR